jgi:hypothetical protein
MGTYRLPGHASTGRPGVQSQDSPLLSLLYSLFSISCGPSSILELESITSVSRIKVYHVVVFRVLACQAINTPCINDTTLVHFVLGNKVNCPKVEERTIAWTVSDS